MKIGLFAKILQDPLKEQKEAQLRITENMLQFLTISVFINHILIFCTCIRVKAKGWKEAQPYLTQGTNNIRVPYIA